MPKLMQNRIVVVARSTREAWAAIDGPTVIQHLEPYDRPVVITTTSHPTTIAGSLGGMDVKAVFYAAHWHKGLQASIDALEAALARLKERRGSQEKIYLDTNGEEIR